MSFVTNEYDSAGYRYIALYGTDVDGKCHCGHCMPGSNSRGKHPKSAAWQQVKESQVVGQNDNVGLLTGKINKIFVVDIDVDERSGKDGYKSLLAHGIDISQIETLRAITPRGGEHFVFQLPDNVYIGNQAGLLQGVDIRGEGGQIVVQPSRIGEKSYEWTNWGDVKPAQCPPKLLELITTQSKQIATVKTEPNNWPELQTLGGQMLDYAIADLCKAKLARSGRGGAELAGAVRLLVRGYKMPVEQANVLLREHYNPRCVPPWNFDDPEHCRNWMHTLLNAPREGEPWGGRLERVTKKLQKVEQEAAPRERTLEVAKRILQEHPMLRDRTENMYEYCDNKWSRVGDGILRKYALDFDEESETRPRRRNEIVQDLKDLSQIDYHFEFNNLRVNQIPFADYLYDVMSGEILPHDPGYYLDRLIPWSLPPLGQSSPVLNSMLKKFWGTQSDYMQRVAAFQEFCGYILLPRAPYKKCLILHGPTDSGKSKLSDIMRLIVGAENTCAIKIQDMGSSRKIAPIVGKALNLVPEIDSTATVSEAGFKSLVSTGDHVEIDGKYQQPFLYQPTAKHVMATNTLPRVIDPTNATYNRWLLLTIPHTLTLAERRPDQEMLDEILADMPQILSWALEGAQRLIANKGRFTDVPSSSEAIQNERHQDDVAQYIFANYVLDRDATHPNVKIAMHDLWRDFQEWAGSKIAIRTFGSRLTAIGLGDRPSKNNIQYVNGVRKKELGDVTQTTGFHQTYADGTVARLILS